MKEDAVKNVLKEGNLVTATVQGNSLYRVSIDLKTKDIDLAQLLIHIKQSKDKQDRITILPKSISKEIGKILALKDKNVFFIPARNKPSLDPVNIRNLKPAGNPLCIRTINSLEAKIISQGNYVSISQ